MHAFGNGFLEASNTTFATKRAPTRRPGNARARTRSITTVQTRSMLVAALVVSTAVGLGAASVPTERAEHTVSENVDIGNAVAASASAGRVVRDTSPRVGVGLDAESRRRARERALELVRAEGEDPAELLRAAGDRVSNWRGHVPATSDFEPATDET